MRELGEDWNLRWNRAYSLLTDRSALNRVNGSIRRIDARADAAIEMIADTPYASHAHRIGIYAGSFNPLTLAHITLAQTVLDFAGLDAVLWSMSRITIDKETVTKAPLAMRLLMMQAVAQTFSTTGVALINRGLYAEQAMAFRRYFPSLTSLAFIVGFDKILQIVDAQYYLDREKSLDALFALADLWVAPRDQHALQDLGALMALPENRRWQQHVHYLPLSPDLRSLSSSSLRLAIAQHTPLQDIPPETKALIDAGGYDC